MSTFDRLIAESFRTFRIFLIAISITAGAKELSEYAAKGNRVVADFNREIQRENAQDLQRLFREHKEE